MMTDNAAILQGFTREVVCEAGTETFPLLIKPDTNLDNRFKAWDMDSQAFIYLSGWLCEVQDTVR